jgi:hypothetical protein
MLRLWLVTLDGYHRLPCHSDECKGALFNPPGGKPITASPRRMGAPTIRRTCTPQKYACHRIKAEAHEIPAIAKGKLRGDMWEE